MRVDLFNPLSALQPPDAPDCLNDLVDTDAEIDPERREMPDKSGKAAEAATEPQKRTRRHHSAATPTQQGQQGQAVEQTKVKNAQRQGTPQESNRTGEQKPRRRTAPSPETGPRQQRPQAERRRHTKPAQDKPSGAEGSTPSMSQAPTRRRRRPGDKGGSNEQ